MIPLVLYCKTYSTDLYRIIRLAKSIQKFNTESIPFHLSVPSNELELFKINLSGFDINLHSDEDIINAAKLNREQIAKMNGSIAQQVIKSSFWQLNLSWNYVCLDSDAFFIRPFGKLDFLSEDGFPYTVLDEGHELLEDAVRQNRRRIVDAFENEANQIKKIFNRIGKNYSFGPFPLVWHRAVWESLNINYLAPLGLDFSDAIAAVPIESRWYGEALLSYKAIPLHPSQALFKVYHYAWQHDFDVRRGVTTKDLSRLYCGVIYQSAWERNLDWPCEGGSIFSKLGRRLRRKFGRI